VTAETIPELMDVLLLIIPGISVTLIPKAIAQYVRRQSGPTTIH